MDDDDEDEDEANDDVSAIGEVKDIRLSLFKTENGTQLFAKPGASLGSPLLKTSHMNQMMVMPVRSDLLLSNTL